MFNFNFVKCSQEIQIDISSIYHSQNTAFILLHLYTVILLVAVQERQGGKFKLVIILFWQGYSNSHSFMYCIENSKSNGVVTGVVPGLVPGVVPGLVPGVLVRITGKE